MRRGSRILRVGALAHSEEKKVNGNKKCKESSYYAGGGVVPRIDVNCIFARLNFEREGAYAQCGFGIRHC